MRVLMSRSPIVAKLETTWQSNKKFCSGILFVDFCSAKVKETTNILTSVEQCLWNIDWGNKERCSVAKVWQLGKSKASQKAESDWIPFAVRETCSKRWIVLNPELKTSAVLTGENFSRTDNSSCSNGWIFYWMDNLSHSHGIPINLERMTNSEQTIFSRLNRYPLVYVSAWEVII